ncbi:hypothetical protein BDR05DRAFT_888265, partial [Suillus weaverae]
GNYQWGLDAGSHQDGWDPYAGLPSHRNNEDRNEGDPDYDENELEVLCLLTFEMIRVNNHLSAGQISVTATLSSQPRQESGPKKRQLTKSHGGPRKRREVALTVS